MTKRRFPIPVRRILRGPGWIDCDPTGIHSNLPRTMFPRLTRWGDILDYTLTRIDGPQGATYELTIWTAEGSYSAVGRSLADGSALAEILRLQLPELSAITRDRQTSFEW
jgi:hypothetical protein